MSLLDDKLNELDDIKKRLATANDAVTAYVGSAAKVPELAKQEILKKVDYNKPLLEQEAGLRAELKTTPSSYAAELQSGRFAGNPILAGQAAAQREANIQKRLDVVRGIRQERMGSIADLVQAVTGAYQAQGAALTATANALKDQYNITLDEYKALDDAEQQKIKNDLAERQQKLDEAKFEETKRENQRVAARSGGGSGSSGSVKVGGKALTAAQIDKYINKAQEIMNDPLISDNPSERDAGEGDLTLSENEWLQALDKIAALVGDDEAALTIANRAWNLGGFKQYGNWER